jgi:hypothetical protein
MSLRDQLEQDLKDLVIADDADTATYTPAAGASYSIMGWFLSEPVEVDAGAYTPIPSSSSRFVVRTSAILGTAKKGDSLTFKEVLYQIKEAKPLGSGITTLVLIRN